MSLPTAYTEHTLADLMHDEIGPLATALSWAVGVSDAGSYAEAVNTVLEMASVDAVSELGVIQARCLARIAVWRRVIKHTAGDFQFSADGGSYSRQQVQEMAAKALAEAETEAANAGYGINCIGVGSITYTHDPFLMEDVTAESEYSNLEVS